MPYIVLFYGIFILVGGVIGHAHGSLASLVMGVAFGLLLLIATGGMFAKRAWGAYTALLATFVLDAFFTFRYLKTMKFMPSGMLALVSLGVMILLVSHLRRKT